MCIRDRTLPYRPPYRWERLLEFLALRAIPGVEAVRGGEYGRTVRLATRRGKDVYGWIRVGHCPVKNALIVVIARSLPVSYTHLFFLIHTYL